MVKKVKLTKTCYEYRVVIDSEEINSKLESVSAKLGLTPSMYSKMVVFQHLNELKE